MATASLHSERTKGGLTIVRLALAHWASLPHDMLPVRIFLRFASRRHANRACSILPLNNLKYHPRSEQIIQIRQEMLHVCGEGTSRSTTARRVSPSFTYRDLRLPRGDSCGNSVPHRVLLRAQSCFDAPSRRRSRCTSSDGVGADMSCRAAQARAPLYGGKVTLRVSGASGLASTER